MKYRQLIGIGSILLALCFSSCDNYLDLEPKDGVTKEKFWKTKEEVKDAVMGCYAEMMTTDNMKSFFLWGELRGELIKPNPRSTNAEYLKVQNGDISSAMGVCSWAGAYRVINNCNTVLHFAKAVQKNDPSFTDNLLAEYEAEAICVRALMYFYLVRTFRDVPYVIEPSLDDDQDYRIAKTDGMSILADLVNQLRQVDRTENGTGTGIPLSYPNTRETKGRFTVWGLKALLADIYLWMEEYEKCIAQCAQIMASGQFTLIPVQSTEVEIEDLFGNITKVYYPSEGDADNLFLNAYVQGNSVESILELQFGTDYENPFWTFFDAASGNFVANPEVVSSFDLFLPSQVDGGWYDIRGEGVGYKQGAVWKWLGLSRGGFTARIRGESFSNWIFYRLSDILLMRAEALTQVEKNTGDVSKLEEALELVRTIRSRACAPESTDMMLDQTTLEAPVLEEFILKERAREFAHEGKRWFDVLRNAKRNQYQGMDHLMNLAMYAPSPDKSLSLQNKWKGDTNSHYLPIHEEELRKNNQLIQNPFYDVETTNK